MNRLLRLGALTAVAVFLAGTTSWADEKPVGKTYAVVVGVGTFADAEIKPRPTADEDARTIAGLLTDKAVGGVPNDQVSVLLSKADEKFGAKEATKLAILKAIGDATKKVGKDDTLLIYLVMQGASAGEKACLFATDSTFKDRLKNGVFGGDLEESFKDLKSEQVAVFVDFNLKAYESKEAILAPNLMEFVRVFLGLKEKDPDAEPPAGRVAFLAGTGINPPVTVEKNGLFTSIVAEALRGKADVEGYEPDGVVTLDEAQKYLEKTIQEKGKAFGKTPEEKLQRSIVLGRGNHFSLTRNPDAAAGAEARLKKFADQKEKLGVEYVEEGTKLLTRMPRLKAMQDLRKSYQKFADGDLTVEQLKTARERVTLSMTLSADEARSFSEKTYAGLSFVRTNYVKTLNMGEMVAQGITSLYRYVEVKMPDDLKERLTKAKGMSDADIKELLREVRKPLGKREDLDENKDVELSLRASLVKFVDKYTDYIDKERVPDIEKDIDGSFRGIGVQIRRDVARDGLLVVTPILNSPAYKGGVVAGDLITEIIRESDSKGEPLASPETTSTKGLETTDAVKLIMGLPTTKIKLKIEREGEEKPLIIELARDTIKVESVFGYKRKEKDDSWDYFVDPKNKIAYIYLLQFSRNSAEEMLAAIQQVQKEGAKGVVLDVRFNPGGLLDQAVDICDMFVDDGVIVSIRPGNNNSRERERVMKGKSEGSYLGFPMVCLVNDNSASGSEILAGCLQDHGRAIIMGERSYGKGSVQDVKQFSATGGKIKLTIATFWPPSGKNLNKSSTTGKDEEEWGVKPNKGYDLKLDRAEKDELYERLYNWQVIPRKGFAAKEPKKEFKDRQLEMALEYLRNQIKVSSNDKVSTKDG